MQVTQADKIKTKRVGVKEELIKFRPSPNFKNMKKFLKSRSDYQESTSSVAPQEPAVQPRVDPQIEVKPVVFQPPLPTYPPPPDSPPLNIVIKQEREDVDGHNSVDEGLEALHREQEQVITEPERHEGDGPRRTMCKEWFRGDCKRTICRFSHELDITQLRGVFTFCWNYQNSRCSKPYCKFVHASIFEEAEFYRTGILPPHARTHLKKPAPPPPPPEEAQPQSTFANPPPPSVLQPIDKPMHMVMTDFGSNVPRSTSPLKRDWSDLTEFTSSPRDLEISAEQKHKKCKHCGILDFRLQINKEKLSGMKQATDEIKQSNEELDNKMNRIYSFLQIFNKQNNKGNVTHNIGEMDKPAEHVNNFGHTNNRISPVASEENVKSFNNIFNGNHDFSNLMAKLLYTVAAEQSLAATESSRET